LLLNQAVRILDATRKSQVVVRLEKLPVLRKTFFCPRCNFKIRHKVPSQAGVNHFKYNDGFMEDSCYVSA